MPDLCHFGDKVSPLSDTTVLASSTAGTPLFTHIRFMMVTTVPSFLITLVIFLIVSLIHEAPSAAQVADISNDLKGAFNISPWLLLVPVVTALLIVKKVSAIVTLFIAAFIAGLFCVAGVIRLMSWYRQRSMKGSWLQLVIGVLDIVIAWIFLGATPMVSVTLVSTLVGIELIFSAASLFSFASLFVKKQ